LVYCADPASRQSRGKTRSALLPVYHLLLNFPYDGNVLGSFNSHKTAKHGHEIAFPDNFSGHGALSDGTKQIRLVNGASYLNSYGGSNFIGQNGNDTETAPACIAVWVGITY